MKPRIYKRNGLWRCRAWGWPHIGIGYTPQSAYSDFMETLA